MKTSEKLTIATIQTSLIWENPEANLKMFEEKINTISSKTDLIILPEMFTTGFTMNATALAENMNGKTVSWMQKIATKKQIAITGSLIINETSDLSQDDNFYNRLVFVHPSGKIEVYDKRHTFTLAKEHETFSAGTKKIFIDYKGWKICPLICYDLRFPVWSRNTNNYDLLIYVASWPKKRVYAWDSLLKARAIENMSYTIGVNRIGLDGNNFEYNGHSIVLDSLGENISKENNEEEDIISVTLSKVNQNTIRQKLAFLNDADAFILK